MSDAPPSKHNARDAPKHLLSGALQIVLAIAGLVAFMATVPAKNAFETLATWARLFGADSLAQWLDTRVPTEEKLGNVGTWLHALGIPLDLDIPMAVIITLIGFLAGAFGLVSQLNMRSKSK